MCINEFWVNENYSRKHLLFNNSNKETFTGNMLDYGSHRYLERHCKPIIEKTITEYENKIS